MLAAADAGEHVDRHEDDAEGGQLRHALVLVDVDEADGGVHQEVDLVEQEGGVAVERVDVAQDLPRLLELLGVQGGLVEDADRRVRRPVDLARLGGVVFASFTGTVIAGGLAAGGRTGSGRALGGAGTAC